MITRKACCYILVCLLLLGNYAVIGQTAFTQQQLRNLTAFTKLYGYIKHFHPTKGAQLADWNRVAVQGSVGALDAANDGDLIDSLNAIFLPITPFYCINTEPCKVDLVQSSHLVYLKHVSYSDPNKELPRNHHRYPQPKLEKVKPNELVNGLRADSIILQGELVAGIHFYLPIAVPTAKKDYPKTKIWALDSYPLDNLSTKLGGIVVTWNIFQHFYPYFNETHPDWEAALQEALVKVATDSTNLQYLFTLQRMLARLKDAHTYASFPAGTVKPVAEMPFVTCWRENQLLIWHIVDTTAGIATGDVIIEVDEQTTEAFMAENEQWISGGATQANLNELNAIHCLIGAAGSMVALTLKKPNGDTVTVNVMRRLIDWNRFVSHPVKRPQPYHIKQIEPGIWLINGTNVTKKDLKREMNHLTNAKGVIIEMRGYPSPGSFRLFKHLLKGKLQTMKLNLPIIVAPREMSEVNSLKDVSQSYRSKKPYIACPTVFLTNHWAMSSGDHMMYYASQFDSTSTIIIGQPTAGSNGVANHFLLPGGVNVRYTGMYVSNSDGSQFHGVGVQPDIYCEPTIESTVNSEDNCLKEAVLWIKQHPINQSTP